MFLCQLLQNLHMFCVCVHAITKLLQGEHCAKTVAEMLLTSKLSGVLSSGGSMTPALLMRQCRGSSRFLNSSAHSWTDLCCKQESVAVPAVPDETVQ